MHVDLTLELSGAMIEITCQIKTLIRAQSRTKESGSEAFFLNLSCYQPQPYQLLTCQLEIG